MGASLRSERIKSGWLRRRRPSYKDNGPIFETKVHKSTFPLTRVDTVIDDSDGVSVLVSVTQPVERCVVKNVSRDPTRAFSATFYDGAVISNYSGARRSGQRTSPWFSVGKPIPSLTESDYSWTNVDNLITSTTDITEVVRLVSRTTLVKLFSSCRKYAILLLRHLQSSF